MVRKNNMIFIRKKRGLGAYPDPLDLRDRPYDKIAAAGEPLDWNKGYDVEADLDFELPFKNQNGSLSCVGQGTGYYTGVLNKAETRVYREVSAKAVYSQIYLPQGGAYGRDGLKVVVNWGAVWEEIVSSYKNGSPPREDFMRDLSWKDDEKDKLAKILQAKSYYVVSQINMDIIAMAIRDGHGTVGGVYVGEGGSWRTNEPVPSVRTGGHWLYFGKFGIDERGKFISTPNSWGTRNKKDFLQKILQAFEYKGPFPKMDKFDWTYLANKLEKTLKNI